MASPLRHGRRPRPPLPLRLCALAIFGLLGPLAATTLGCGSGGGSDPFVRVPTSDASVDGGPDGSILAGDAAVFDPTLGGPCLDDGQCNDDIACTFDRCDFSAGNTGSGDGGAIIGRCRITPDDAQCADNEFCNGREKCVVGLGCRPGPVETCQDNDSCTVDTCIEAQKACTHAPRDLDGDGDPDDRCVAAKDCDDQDADIASTRSEVCGNGKDDNCNTLIDEAPCATPAADTCATALAIQAPGTYALSTVATTSDVPLSCAATGKDVVASVTIPAGANRDLDVWVSAPNADLALAVQGTCGSGGSELTCRGGASATRVRARNLAPGTYAVVVKTQTETAIELSVDFLAATPAPTNETCGTAAPITVGTPFPVTLIDPAKDLPTACTSAAGELTYSFSLAQAADVRAYATVLRGTGTPALSLRSAACAAAGDEIRCREDTTLPLFARNMPAGNYVLAVGAPQSIDASIVVTTSTPTTAPADETCASAPALALDTSVVFDLDAHDDDIVDGCYDGNPDAAYSLSLAQASDVLLVARFPPGDSGSVALAGPACTTATRLACTVDQSPVRASVRNVPAGSYRAIVADRQGRLGSLLPLVRPTLPPTNIGTSDGCTNVMSIPATGGYFVGDTTNAVHDFTNGCDQGGGTSSPDLVLKLELTQTRRVVLDMSGSTYTTLLSIRQGTLCPGLELGGACHVGFNGNRSFLDRVLAAGTYWIVVDGFNGDSGTFALDARIIAP